MTAKLSRLYNFSGGTPARSGQVDAEFDQLIAMFNALIGISGGETTSSSVTLDIDTYGEWVISALADNVIFNEPSGTPYDGQPFVLAIKDAGVSKSLTFTPAYFTWIATQVTATVPGKWLYLGLKYREVEAKWHIVAVRQQA